MLSPVRLLFQSIRRPDPALCLTGTLLGLLVYSAAAFAGEDLSAMLKKMARADDELNYQGVFILRKADQLMSMRVEHGVDKRGVWESLEALNGENREIVRNNDEVTSFYPDQKLMTVSHVHSKTSLHPSLPENLDKLGEYYQINQLKNDRIANHDTTVIDVQPNDNFRYGYRYWIDTKTGVLLKCDLLNEKKSVIEQMMFTSMKYMKQLPKTAFVEPSHDGYTLRKLDQLRGVPAAAEWTVSQLPKGFVLTQSTRHDSDDGASLHMMYSDGLASVSLFVEPDRAGHHHLKGASSIGALNAYGAKVDDHYLTVMGDVPASTILQIANSAHPVHPATMKNDDD